MGKMSGNELDVVRALSEVDLPPDMVAFSKIGDLIKGLNRSSSTLGQSSGQLDRLRKEREQGNFLSNWWDNVDDKIKDASLDVSQQLADVNRHAAQLLVINTALSKMLNGQQQVLLSQQSALDQQASQIAQQNTALHEYQQDFRNQQGDISQANQRLLDAHAAAQRLAGELMACLDQVTESEQRHKAVTLTLLDDVARNFSEAVEQVDAKHGQIVDERLAAFAHEQQAERDAQQVERDAHQATRDVQLSRLKTVTARAVAMAAVGLLAGMGALVLQLFTRL